MNLLLELPLQSHNLGEADLAKLSCDVVPSGNDSQFAMKMAIEIESFPIENGGSTHSYLNVYQRVN